MSSRQRSGWNWCERLQRSSRPATGWRWRASRLNPFAAAGRCSARATGLGLRIMRYRAERIGGRFQIDRRRHHGTTGPARARKRASLSRNAISARLRLVISRPLPQYPEKTSSSSYTGSPLIE